MATRKHATRARKARAKTKSEPGTQTRRPARPGRPHKTREYRPEEIIRTNGVMDLDPRLLQMTSARAMAKSIKRSADRSDRVRSTPFHASMSVLNTLLSHVEVQKARLEAAKKELRKLYGEADETPGTRPPTPPAQYARHRGSSKKSVPDVGPATKRKAPRPA